MTQKYSEADETIGHGLQPYSVRNQPFVIESRQMFTEKHQPSTFTSNCHITNSPSS